MLDYRSRYAVAAQEDRSAPRVALNLPATLRPSGEHAFSTIVTDLSLSGFSAVATSGMRPGNLCWLNIGACKGLQAEVMWNDGTRIGCAFASLLNPAVFDAIVARA